MNTVSEINAKDHADGWYASRLKEQSQQLGKTMAALYELDFPDAVARNVLAECTRITAKWIFYKFADGSTSRYKNNDFA